MEVAVSFPFDEMTAEDAAACVRDVFVTGTATAIRRPDGTAERVPPDDEPTEPSPAWWRP